MARRKCSRLKQRRILFESLERRCLLASDLPPLIDLNTLPASEFAEPTQLAEAGGRLFFSAAGSSRGIQLWRSDGIPEGTVSVRDLGFPSSVIRPDSFANVGGTLFFAQSSQASRGTGGSESALWKSDGTFSGTVLVKDIKPSYPTDWSYSDPLTHLTSVGNRLYFVANNGSSGRELWKSDGTEAGTQLVKDISAGPSHSDPDHLTNINGTLFFAVTNGVEQGLWKSDGTEEGTVRVTPESLGAGNNVSNIASFGNTIYFAASGPESNRGLWKSDGTPEGTLLVTNVSSIIHLTVVEDMLYFSGNNPTTGSELWKSDGTAAGTMPVKDIRPGSASSQPQELINHNGTLFFTADDGSTGRELWKSDGTEIGTARVKDIRPGPIGGDIRSLTSFEGRLFFTANDGTNGDELWRSSGSEAGTGMLVDIAASSASSSPDKFTLADGQLYFRAKNLEGKWELWRSDSTISGTFKIGTPLSVNQGAFPYPTLEFDGKLFFTAFDGSTLGSVQLYQTDGSLAGTSKVTDLPSVHAFDFVNIGGTVYFQATDGGNYHLWKSDGTASGTQRVSDVSLGRFSRARTRLTELNGVVYFAANDGTTGYELWRSDGTMEGTRVVKDLDMRPPTRNGGVYYATELNGQLYFSTVGPDGLHGLYRTDGTENGTQRVKGGTAGSEFLAGSLMNVGGSLFFVGDTGNRDDFGLWISDGTQAGTVLVKRADPRERDWGRLWFHLGFNGELYFSATDREHGEELWKSDGTEAGTVLVKDINPGPLTSSPFHLTVVGDSLFFTAFHPDTGTELWKTDGTEVGTVLVKNILPSERSSRPSRLLNANGTLYFQAYDDIYGTELWKSDGTEAGTVLVADIAVNGSSNPLPFLVFEDHLYFSAFTNTYGTELYRVPLNAPASEIVDSFVYYAGSPLASVSLENALDQSKQLAKETHETRTLGFDNLINAAGGITGLVFDFGGKPVELTSGDFEIRVSPTGAFNEANHLPHEWELGPAPTSVEVSSNGVISRVVLEWPANTIADRWLRVAVLSGENTGLSDTEVYYIGHLGGEVSGLDSAGIFTVSFRDISMIRSGTGTAAAASSTIDLDKDGLVDMNDILIARSRVGSVLRNITIGSPKPTLAHNPVSTNIQTGAYNLANVLPHIPSLAPQQPMQAVRVDEADREGLSKLETKSLQPKTADIISAMAVRDQVFAIVADCGLIEHFTSDDPIAESLELKLRNFSLQQWVGAGQD